MATEIQQKMCNDLINLKKRARNNLDPNFKFYPEDLDVLKKIYYYTIKDKINCSNLGIDLTKGILLNGPVGCGKTAIMKVFNHLAIEQSKYSVRPVGDLVREFAKNEHSMITKYGKSKAIYCFDDLGSEQVTKHFGNEVNVLGEILLSRYEYYKSYGVISHITTNLNANELECFYGTRVRSRFKEMFNLISFPGSANDKRK